MIINRPDNATGLYFHIPYCKRACHYCNFHFSTSLQSKSEMVDAMIREIDITRGKRISLVTTIYFGGGTPSSLLRKELRTLMEAVRKYFNIQPGAETTYEVNPDDMNEMSVPFWKQQGINRLSIGIQSFRDEDLQWMNRAHTAEQAVSGIELARAAGFSNFSIDLIYGVPGLDDEAWKANLAKAIELDIPHISAYALTVEPRTALNTMIEQGKKTPVDPEQQARQFLIAMDMLEQAGYEHYEISNFAKPGMRSQHNSSYWDGIPYFGFGPGAHSFDGHARYWNISNNARYINSMMQGIIPYDKEDLTRTQMLNEYIMTSLRTMEGLDLGRVRDKWGPEMAETLVRDSKKHRDQALLTLEQDVMKLTRQGKLFADGIAADLFFIDPQPATRTNIYRESGS
jgi:oxygen-independent coproporphyrinogen-3 oxidase